LSKLRRWSESPAAEGAATVAYGIQMVEDHFARLVEGRESPASAVHLWSQAGGLTTVLTATRR